MTISATIVFLVAVIPSIETAYCTNGKLDESAKSVVDAKVVGLINEMRGKIVEGTIKGVPQGTTKMNKIEWDCNLEQEAIDLLDVPDCPAEPKEIVTDKTPLFWGDYDRNIPLEQVISVWLEDYAQLDSFKESTNLRLAYDFAKTGSGFINELCSLVRASTTGIGCVEKTCIDGKHNTNDTFNNVYCLTNDAAFENNDTIYEIGSGCKSEECDSGKICIDGLCDIPPETTTTAAETTTTTTTEVVTTATTAPVTHPGELANGTNQQCPDNVGMTDELRMHFLDTQNYRRSTLAKGQVQRPSGNYLPTGANILKLKLDCLLEKRAIEEVQDCPTSKKSDDMYGKNFDTFPSSTVTSTYKDAIKKAVTNWWKVVRTESNGPGMQVIFRSNHVNQPVETYSQIGWAKTQYLGCAIAKCSSSYTVICLYDPEGNQVDQPLYQIGSTCAACPVGTKCESSLGLCA